MKTCEYFSKMLCPSSINAIKHVLDISNRLCGRETHIGLFCWDIVSFVKLSVHVIATGQRLDCLFATFLVITCMLWLVFNVFVNIF